MTFKKFLQRVDEEYGTGGEVIIVLSMFMVGFIAIFSCIRLAFILNSVIPFFLLFIPAGWITYNVLRKDSTSNTAAGNSPKRGWVGSVFNKKPYGRDSTGLIAVSAASISTDHPHSDD